MDDEGTPVSGALARVAASARPTEERPDSIVYVEGLTDQEGLFSGEVRAWSASDAGYRVVKDGHYIVWLPFHATRKPFGAKWEPWNPTIPVVLKRIRNPVPMYAKRLSARLPVSAQYVGFDLVVGDWVHPHGHGVQTDILFRGTGQWTDNRNFFVEVTATFPGHGDGLIPHIVDRPRDTVLRMPYEAPESGYAGERTWRMRRRYDNAAKQSLEYLGKPDETENFFIRVRSETDKDGKIVRAMYGKIHAPFQIGITPTAVPAFHMTYFLNPDGTRNIEYDPKRNLLKSSRRRDPNYENLGP